MTPKQETWSIVLVGHWNRMIFTPKWVGQTLFKQDEVTTKVPLTPELPVFYIRDDLMVGVSFDRVFVKPIEMKRDAMAAVEQMAYAILTELPHTPISGVGVNFGFTEPAPPESLTSMFTLADRIDVDHLNWEVEALLIKRRMRLEGQLLNLSLVQDEQGTSIEGNFHTDVENTEQAKSALHDKVCAQYDLLCRLLLETHGLRLT
jgi:hypothetical protein